MRVYEHIFVWKRLRMVPWELEKDCDIVTEIFYNKTYNNK